MWEDRLTVNFLVASPERTSILGRGPLQKASEVLALAWPHGDMSDVLGVLSHPAQIDVWPGPLERGDRDAEPRLLYVAFRATRGRETQAVLTQFEDGIELIGWDTEPVGDAQTRLRLRWRTARPLLTNYTVFVHLVRDSEVLAQDDGTPGSGFFPTTWWKPGDEIVDVHLMDTPFEPGQEKMIVGWYELGSMRHLRVLSKEGQPGTDRFELNGHTSPDK
jgi:hypothetical protein